MIGIMVEWLGCCGCDQHGIGSNPTCAILLCPWEKHFKTFFPTLRSWQAVLNSSHISIKLKNQNKKLNFTPISWHLWKQVGEIVTLCIAPMLLSCKSER